MTKGNVGGSRIRECDTCVKRGMKNSTVATVWLKELNRFLCKSCLTSYQDVMPDAGTLVEIEPGKIFLPAAGLHTRDARNTGVTTTSRFAVPHV